MSETPNFDRLARLYHWMEFFSFGPWLALTRRTFLVQTEHARHALVLGDGDGRFTATLLRTNSTVQVDAVDASSAMLGELLRRAGPNAGRVKIHLGDVRHCEPLVCRSSRNPSGDLYDLIATHFFLDCLSQPEVRDLAAKIRGVSDPGAVWIVSDFAVPDGWFGALAAAPIVSLLYWCFGWLTGLKVRSLPDHVSALQSAGFSLVERRTRLGGLLVSELWEIRG